MNRVLARLTARQLLGKRRTLLAAAVMLLPIVIGVFYALFAEPSLEAGEIAANPELERVRAATDAANFAADGAQSLMLGLLVPIMALVVGTAALGSEMEDGTAVFLLSKPVGRTRIFAVKTLIAVAVCVILVTPASLISTWLVVGSPTTDGLMLGFGLTVLMAAVMYTVVFVALSAVTHRSILIGLGYVFLWEALVTNLFPGLSWVSISDYAYGWGNAFISTEEISVRVEDSDLWFEAPYRPSLGLTASVIGTLVIVALAGWVGAERLSRFQIGDRK